MAMNLNPIVTGSGRSGERNERRGAMMKIARVASVTALVGLAAGVGFFSATPIARAASTSDKPAAILTWPKVVVDTLGNFGVCVDSLGKSCSKNSDCGSGGVCNATPTDTLIQLSNTSRVPKQARCFYVDATDHCNDGSDRVCRGASDCPLDGGGFAPCAQNWNEIDFDIFITPDQPLAWYASRGLHRTEFPKEGPGTCNNRPGLFCFSDNDCGAGGCNLGDTNLGSGVPPTSEDPFIGSLTCIEFDPTKRPPVPDQSDTRNTLKGEAAIIALPPDSELRAGVDVQKYNAVGLQATGNQSGLTGQLQIGPDNGDTGGQEYAACPATLILNHLFDGATDPISGDTEVDATVRTDLTLVPCGNNLLTQTPGRVIAHFLVFNEFEQRFSAIRTVDCFLESQLSRIDTSNPTRSIFNAGVSGTIAGQSRIRGVGSAATGRGLLGVARVFFANAETTWESGAGYNLHQFGEPADNVQADVITIP